LQKPSSPQAGSVSPSLQVLKSRPLKRAGRAIGRLGRVDETQQSRTVLHATRSPGSAALDAGVVGVFDAGVVGAFESVAADTDGADAPWARAEGAGSLGLAVAIAFGAGASPVAEGGPGVEQAAKSASESAARSMIGPYHCPPAGDQGRSVTDSSPKT
jgi:hypothetical protein